MFNSTQVKELFDKEAILIGSKDVVPISVAQNIFDTGPLNLLGGLELKVLGYI